MQLKTRALDICVDLSAITHNLSVARQLSPGQKLFAVIKADAYGHGAARVAKALDDADAFAVVTLNEALELRESGIDKPILVLQGAYSQSSYADFTEYALWPVVHCEEQLQWLFALQADSAIQAWIKVDTGMGRLGFQPARAQAILNEHHNIEWVGALTHFACADETDNPITTEQIKVFRSITSCCSIQTSLANSAAVLAWPDAQADWSRPGIMLYGCNPLDKNNVNSKLLKPAMRVSTILISCKQYAAGATIGYGASYVCPEPMTIGYAAIGYGDGFPRVLDDTATVWIAGLRCPIVGRVSMDSIAIDLRNIERPEPGVEVVLWGPEHSVDILAKAAGTISYELLTSIAGSKRYVET